MINPIDYKQVGKAVWPEIWKSGPAKTYAVFAGSYDEFTTALGSLCEMFYELPDALNYVADSFQEGRNWDWVQVARTSDMALMYEIKEGRVVYKAGGV